MKVVKIGDETHRKSKETANLLGKSLNKFAEEALKEKIEKHRYSFDNLMKLVSQYSSLSLYKEIINAEFEDAPVSILRDIINVIEKGNPQFFYLDLYDKEKLREIFEKETDDIVVVAKVDKKKNDTKENIRNKAGKITSQLEKAEGEGKHINLVLKGDESVKDNPELLVFISRKQGDKESDING